jgi:hypothetical protein
MRLNCCGVMPITPIMPAEKRFQKQKTNGPTGSAEFIPRVAARNMEARNKFRAPGKSAIAAATTATAIVIVVTAAAPATPITAAVEASAGVIILLPGRCAVLRRSGTHFGRLPLFERPLWRCGRRRLGAEPGILVARAR